MACQCISAQDLGALCNGVADDGAILTAALAAQFGTLAGSPSQTTREIDFGDGSLVYNLKTPIIVQQNYIRLVGRGARLNCKTITSAVVADFAGSGNNLFGVAIIGMNIEGTVTGDAVRILSGTQCEVAVRNKGVVAGAVVHLIGTLSSRVESYSDAEVGAQCQSIYRESVLSKNNVLFNCINNHAYVVSYYATGAAVRIQESDGFRITGDIERNVGPAVDLFNARLGFVSIYTEANGSGATNVGVDTSDDVRIRSAPGQLVSRSVGINIVGSSFGGELVNGNIPTNIHVIGGDSTCITANSLGGKLVLEQDAEQTFIGPQGRLLGPIVDNGSNSVNMSFGREVFKANQQERLVIDGRASGGAKIGSNDNLLRLYGLVGLSMGQTPARNLAGFVDVGGTTISGTIVLPAPEADANYIPMLSLWDLGGGAVTKSVVVAARNASSITYRLDAAPGAGQTVRVHWLVVRTT